MSDKGTKSTTDSETGGNSRLYGIACAVLALLLVVIGFLYMQTRGQLDDLRAERDALVQDKAALEQELVELRNKPPACDPQELRIAREQLEQAERARAQAEEALALARAASQPGDCPTPATPPPRTGDCPAQKACPACPACPGDDACQAALKRERALRMACEKELNSEIRDTLR